MNKIRQKLEERYNNLFNDYHLERPLNAGNICQIIRLSLQDFLKDTKRPAIYCNGGHTEMLMADFMHELKKVRHIVDNYAASEDDKGFILIKDEDIEEHGIDAIVLSSYKFRVDLKQKLKENHPDIPVLDIYDEFEQRGIMVQADYYYSNHPYQHYKRINQLQREIHDTECVEKLEELYTSLVTKYIHIKDFRTTIIKLNEWKDIRNLSEDSNKKIAGLIQDVEALYELEKEAAALVSNSHVLMLCIDGLRYEDLSAQYMPQMDKMFRENDFVFDNAYSFSTSTYESLLPVYSENSDLKTVDYDTSTIPYKKCRFVKEAIKQNRHIHFYTDMDSFVECDDINYSNAFQTATQKLWSFILDAVDNDNGLFYIHIVYESHYSFSNPYTEEKLISEGTAMLFDFLPQKGRKLRTNYERQHQESIHYLDDVLTPLVSLLKCRVLVYADHGNLVLKPHCAVGDIPETKFTFAEEWIRIPYIIRSPEMGKGSSGQIISLMSLNDIIVSLMNQESYVNPTNQFIKVARSELYNPDFRYLYREIGKEKCLLAFEAFVFQEGYKLAVYADGTVEIYRTDDDKRIDNSIYAKELFIKVKDYITVCDVETIPISI